MSRTYSGRRVSWPRASNKHVNGEIWGRSDYTIGPDDKVYPRAGGERVGGPGSKKFAKKEANGFRRRIAKAQLRAEVIARAAWGGNSDLI